MKRYDLMCDGHYANNAVEDDDGEWVPAEVAQALYDALGKFVTLSRLDGDNQRWPLVLASAEKALSLADGDEQ
jgi:hypothetical protein